MNYAEDEDYTIRWSFFSFHGLLPPQFAWITAFIGSVEQCGSTGWHSPGALLFLGVAKRQLLGCSASVEILQFCTCFLDNWHLKGRLWLLTVCPWPALGFSLKNCLFQPVTVWVFLCKVVVKSRPTAADVAESCIWTIWVEQLGGGLHTRALTLPCLQRFNSKTAFHWECFWVIV